MKAAVLALSIAVVAACGPSANDAANSASGTPVTGVSSNQTTQPNQTPITQPTAVRPAPTPAPQRALTITATGYGSASANSLGYGYTVKNENASEAAESITVQVAFQDAAGVVLGTDSDSIPFIGPGDHIGIGGTGYFQNTNRVAKMTVQVLPSRWTASPVLPKFSFANVTYIDDRFFSKVTGVMTSPYTKDYKFVRASAIGLDASGAIVGGGFTFVDFAPASGQVAVSVSYTGAKPATVVLHAQLSNLSN